MLRPQTNSHDLPPPDFRGRIRPCVGILQNGRKARFQVGDVKTSRLEAERRLSLIRTLYEKQCGQQGVSYWREWVRQVAVKIGMGQAVVDTCIGDETTPATRRGSFPS